MKFSIIVPVYNVNHEYFRECIDSLIHQTYKNIEIILINDGSTNGCEHLCNEFKVLDHRIKVFHQNNQGVSIARNKGIIESKSDYLMFVDPDDWIELNTCEIIHKKILKYPDADYIGWTQSNHMRNNIITKTIGYNEIYKLSFQDKEKYIKQILYLTKSFVMNSKNFNIHKASSCMNVYRKEILIQHNIFFDENLCRGEDLVFNIYYLHFAKNIYYLDIPFYNYRIHSNSKMRKYDAEFSLQERKFYYETQIYRDKLNLTFFPVYYDTMVNIRVYLSNLSNNLFHANNEDSYFNKKRKWKNMLVKDKVLTFIFEKVSKSDVDTAPYLDKKEKIALKLTLNKNFIGLYSLYYLRNKIK